MLTGPSTLENRPPTVVSPFPPFLLYFPARTRHVEPPLASFLRLFLYVVIRQHLCFFSHPVFFSKFTEQQLPTSSPICPFFHGRRPFLSSFPQGSERKTGRPPLLSAQGQFPRLTQTRFFAIVLILAVLPSRPHLSQPPRGRNFMHAACGSCFRQAPSRLLCCQQRNSLPRPTLFPPQFISQVTPLQRIRWALAKKVTKPCRP